jgi:hypothetical protein
MTEQDRFEAWHLAQFGVKPDRATNTTHIDYLRGQHQLMWRGWQAAIESREPAKDVDMEALKRGQENAENIWTAENIAQVLGTAKEMK